LIGPARQANEQFLQQIAGVGFIAGKIEEEAEKCRGVFIVQAVQWERRRHGLIDPWTHADAGFV